MIPYLVIAAQANQGEIRGCSDDRDRLYALLSLGPKRSWSDTRPEFTPNYKLSVEEAYTDFARCALRAGALEILDFAGLWFRKPIQQSIASSGASPNNLPSWAPEFRLPHLGFVQEFRQRTGHHPDLPWVCVESEDIYGKRNLEDCIRVLTDEKRISIKGVIVDEVAGAKFGTRSRSSVVDQVLAWLPRCALLCTEYAVSGVYQPTGEPINKGLRTHHRSRRSSKHQLKFRIR